MALDLGELFATLNIRGDGARREIRGTERDLDRLDRKADDSGGRMSGAFDGIGAALGRVGGSLAPIGLGLAKFGAAVPAAAGLAAALVQIAPAAAVGATAIVGVGVAAAALKIGMSGVGDAAKAAFDPSDPKAYAAALAKLSPNARAFVGVLHDMAPQFAGIKRAVQDTLFAGLDKQLRSTATATLPALYAGLHTAAGALNEMASGVLSSARGLAADGTLGQAIRSATGGLGSLTKIPGQVVKGLVQIAAAAGPTFQRLTSGVGSLATTVSQKLNRAFSSGAMEKAIDTAVGLLKDLASVASNVFTVVRNIFSATQATGGGFIGTLKTISAELAKVSGNPAVQAGLRALFQTMSTLATTAAPLLGQVLQELAPVLVALGPPLQVLIQQLGVALQPVIAALGPALVAIARSFGGILIAVAPLLPVLGNLIAGILTPLTPLLGFLVPAITGIVGALRVWSVVQGVLNVVLAANPIGLVVIAIGGLVAGLIYAYKHSETFRDVVNSAWATVKGAVAGAWSVIRPILSALGTFFTGTLAPAASALASKIGEAFGKIKEKISGAWDGIKQTLSEFVGFLDTNVSTSISNLVKGIDGIGDSVQALPGKLDGLKGIGQAIPTQGGGQDGGESSIGTALSLMINRMKTDLTGFFTWANTNWGGFLDGIGGIVSRGTAQIQRDWSGPWKKIIDYNAYFFSLITAVATKGIKALGEQILAPWPAIQAKWVAATNGLPKAATQAVFRTIESVGTLPGQIAAIAARTWASLPRSLAGTVTAVNQKLAALKAGITRAFASAPTWLLAAGRAIVNGLLAGIQGRIPSLSSLLNSITSKIPQWKGPPGRDANLLVPAGHAIMGGLVRGINDGVPALNRRLAEITRAAAAAAQFAAAMATNPAGLGAIGGAVAGGGQAQPKLPAPIPSGGGGGTGGGGGGGGGGSKDKPKLTNNAVTFTYSNLGKAAVAAFIKGLSSFDPSKIDATAKSLSDAVKKAFAGFASKTKIDDGLLALIASTNKKLQGMATERQKIADKLKEALAFAADVEAGGKSFASALGLKFTDADGQEVAPQADTIISGLKGQLTKLRDFGADIATLVQAKLSPTVLRQLLQAGPEQASAMADAIAAGGANAVNEINNVQGQIDAASKSLGEVGADYLYDAGAKAGDGFLTGLKGQLDVLEQSMEDLATRLLNAVTAGIAKAQKIAAKAAMGETPSLTELGVGSTTKAAPKATPKLAAAAAPKAALHIENYHEAPGSSARATAEDLLFMAKARG